MPYCEASHEGTRHDQLAQLLQSFDEVFVDELGALQGSKASKYIDPKIPPQFCKACSLP